MRVTLRRQLLYKADDLLIKLREIERLILENVNPDESCDFDTERIYLSLELTRRMFEKE